MCPVCSSLPTECSTTCQKGGHPCNPGPWEGSREVLRFVSLGADKQQGALALSTQPCTHGSEARWEKLCETHLHVGLGERWGS